MMFRRLGLINRNQTGLTLMELVIAIAITSIIVSTVTVVTFQVFDGEARSSNHIDAISRAQDAGLKVSQDAGMAQIVALNDDEDGFPLTLTWTEWESNETYQIVYSIVNNRLQREEYINGVLNGTPYVFEYIISTDPDTEELKTYCERIDGKLIFTITATAGVGSQRISETRVYEAIPRPSI